MSSDNEWKVTGEVVQRHPGQVAHHLQVNRLNSALSVNEFHRFATAREAADRVFRAFTFERGDYQIERITITVERTYD